MVHNFPGLLERKHDRQLQAEAADLQDATSGSDKIWDRLAEQASCMASEATDTESRRLIEEIAERYGALARHSRNPGQ